MSCNKTRQSFLSEVNVCKTMPTNPCQHGGTCVKFGASFECQCAPGWAGDRCEEGEHFLGNRKLSFDRFGDLINCSNLINSSLI